MRKLDKVKALLAIVCVSLMVTTWVAFSSRMVFLFPTYYKVLEQYQYIVGREAPSLKIEIHSTVNQYRWIDGEKYLIFSYSHPAALTQIGENFTAAKMSGDTSWNTTCYTYNVTYISLGDDVGLGTSSTNLPNEWNRTVGTFEYLAVGQWNYSASFYPTGSGSTNATGLNWDSGIGEVDDTLWAYDTFSTISYTSNDQIDVEWSVDVQYS